jgi:signal transduction histidine kinase/CheY-like chemotaxis protein
MWPAGARGQSWEFSFEHYRHGHGLARESIRALWQDREGYLWIGTRESLCRYDGGWFRQFGPEAGLTGAPVNALYEDEGGTLWVGTRQGLYYRAGERFHLEQADQSISVTVADSIQARAGGLYVGAAAGLFIGEAKPGSRLRRVAVPADAGGAGVGALEVDEQGTVWAICGKSLCVLRDGVLRAAGRQLGLPDGEWTALKRDGAGAWWVRSQHELWRRAPGADTFARWPEAIPGSSPASLALDPGGHLAVPSEFGVRILANTPAPWLREQEGLPRGSVSTVYWDRGGVLWIGLASNGLARLQGRGAWQSSGTGQRLGSNTVTSIVRDQRGWLWAGTRFGLSVWKPGGRGWEPVRAFDNRPIRTLAEDGAGGLWIGTARHGIYRLELAAGALRRFGPRQGLTNDQPIAFHRLGPGELWLSTRGGVFAVPARAPWRFVAVEAPYPADVYRLLRARDGTLWAAGRRGLSRRDGGVWKTYAQDIGLRHREVVFLSEGPDGDLWVGYGPPHGVTRVSWKAGAPTATHFRAPWPLGSDDLSFLETDRQGRIWVGTDNGVSVFDGVAWSHFGRGDGMVSADTVLNAFWQDADDAVLIGTNQGLARFQPRLGVRQPDPSRVVLSSFETGGRAAELPEVLRTFPVRFRFASPLFDSERQFHYRYRLVGSGGEWIETDRGEAAFERLEPGSYRLEAAVRRPYGRWSETVRLAAFEVAPPWWSAWWFRLTSLVVAAGLGRLLWRWRENIHLARRRELELAVSQRTREIEAKSRQIETLLEKANEANDLKRQFLANISHELRTPMNGVLGMTELALAGPLTPEQRENLTLAHQAGSSLLALLNDLLDYSRLESGRLALHQVTFPLRSTVESVYASFEPAAAAKGLAFHLRWDPCLPEWVSGDPLRLRQILRNLTANALKFTEAGQIELTAEAAEAAGPVMVRFSIRDTGIGIPYGKQEAIFDAFVQSDGSSTRRFGGSGLGLSIAASLVKLMGGRIWVESAPGQGSTFSFLIPLPAAPRRNGRPPAAVSAEATPHAPKVLIAEDNPVNQKLAARLLSSWGYETVVVPDGADAVREWERQAFDLILMDVHMPSLSGIDATRQIRQRERQRGVRVPILGFTAAAMLEEQAQCLEAGMDDCVTKPLRAEELRQQVTRFAGLPPAGCSASAVPSLQSQ